MSYLLHLNSCTCRASASGVPQRLEKSLSEDKILRYLIYTWNFKRALGGKIIGYDLKQGTCLELKIVLSEFIQLRMDQLQSGAMITSPDQKMATRLQDAHYQFKMLVGCR